MEKKTTAFVSKEYDEKIIKTLPYYQEFTKQTIEVVKASNKKNLSWLDIGCGTGALAAQVLKEMSVKSFVLNDINENMLDLARKRLQDAKVEISFVQVPSQQIKYCEEFDVITAIQVHHYLTREERKLATSNCYAALKEGGMYITFENYAPFSADGTQNALERWKSYQLSQGRPLNEVEEHIKRFGVAYYPINIAEHIELLRECGFKSVEVFWVSCMQAGFWAEK